MNILPYLQGVGVAISLIVVIGAQNAYVLNQGLKARHSVIIPTLCALIDITLIAVGVGGLGYLITLHPVLVEIARWFGAIFLIGYGVRSLYLAFHSKGIKLTEDNTKNLKATVLTILALSLLNPGVYLDTVVLIGSIGAQHPPEQRLAFALGAMTISAVWFYGLTWGARLLSPVLRSPKAWRVIDIITAIIMFIVAVSLIV